MPADLFHQMAAGSFWPDESFTTDGMLAELTQLDTDTDVLANLPVLKFFTVVNTRPQARKLVLPAHLEHNKYTIAVWDVLSVPRNGGHGGGGEPTWF